MFSSFGGICDDPLLFSERFIIGSLFDLDSILVHNSSMMLAVQTEHVVLMHA